MVLRIQGSLGGGKRVRLGNGKAAFGTVPGGKTLDGKVWVNKTAPGRAGLPSDARLGAIAAEVLSAVARMESAAVRPPLALVAPSSDANLPLRPKRKLAGKRPRRGLRLVHPNPAGQAKAEAPGLAQSVHTPVRAEPRTARRDASVPLDVHRLSGRLRRRLGDVRLLARIKAATAHARPPASRQPTDRDRQQAEVSTTGPPPGRRTRSPSDAENGPGIRQARLPSSE